MADDRGVPLSLVVTGANRHDVTQLEAVLDNVVVPRPGDSIQQNLCADAAYTGAVAYEIIVAHGYTPHVRSRGEEKRDKVQGYRPHRWVVEASHSWLNRFRKIIIRYEKTDASYIALLSLACAIIAYRKVDVIYG